MANSVTFPTAIGGDGSTVTDDDNPSTGLANGGAIVRLIPMFSQVVAIINWASTQISGIAANAAAALALKNAAAASAAAAATSVTQVNTLGSATGLQTTGASVAVSAASPPTAGQALVATDATHATWQTVPPDFLLINAGII